MLDVTRHNFTQVQNFMPTCMRLVYSLLKIAVARKLMQ